MESIKQRHMHELFLYKQRLRKSPQLRRLFLELTLRCNENCLHCGSRCGDVKSEEMPVQAYFEFLDKIKRDFSPKLPMLCITGGEPLLREEFAEIMGYAHKLGFKWGMTSNATLIDEEKVQMLKDTGMGTISVSIDGLKETHDTFRRSKGGFERAVRGIKLLMQGGFQEVQVTTVVTKKSLPELDELFELMKELDVDSWRVIGIEPMGRALELQDYFLSMDEQRKMLDFIRAKRREGWPVMYGCSHYLGLEYEREVRDWYFLCNAGVYTASIMANGNITACLDIERREETIQGNILKDDFTKVWKERFEIYRTPLWEKNEKCRDCRERDFCEGGSYHSWDFDKNEQRVCFISEGAQSEGASAL
ncbi:MAG: radical SAM protein [Ruminococcus sp.]|nr:radical SAM protein [Ruminococcus sp.]